MTALEVAKRVAAIRAAADDNEQAHAMEDALRDVVLQAIANGAENAAELAREVLRTGDIEFSRWYA